MRVALDTNVPVYAEGLNGEDRQQRALAALASFDADELLVPAQALAELFYGADPQGAVAGGESAGGGAGLA